MKKLLATIFILSVITSCSDDESSTSNPAAAQSSSGNQYLDENIILPPGSFKVSEDSIIFDNSITITSNSNDTSIVTGGENMTVDIDFTAQNANVTHAGIRFGTSGDITMIPISGALGNSSGTLSFPTQIPASLCTDIAKICHDVKCYEFAVAQGNDGQFRVSSENINQLVANCGACDLPSCKSLITQPCDSGGGTGGGGGTIGSSSLFVDGSSINISYSECYLYGGRYVLRTTDDDPASNLNTYNDIYITLSAIPTVSATYSIVASYNITGTNQAFFEFYTGITGLTSPAGGTVDVIVNGSSISCKFNNVILREPYGTEQISVSGEIVCD